MKVSRKRKTRDKIKTEIPNYVMNVTNRQPIYGLPIRREPVSFQLYSPGTEPDVGTNLIVINQEKQFPKRCQMKSKEPIEVIIISDDEDTPCDEDDLYLPTVQIPKLDVNHLKYLSSIHTISNYSEIFQELFDYDRVNRINENMKNFRSIKKIRQTQNLMPDIRISTLKVDRYQRFIQDNYAREKKIKRNTTFMFNYYVKNKKQNIKPLSSVELLSQSEERHDSPPIINTQQSNYASPEANLYQTPKTDYFYPKPYMNLIPPVINQQPEYINSRPSRSNTNPEPSTSSSTMLDSESESEIKPRPPPKKRRPKNAKQRAAILNLAKSLIENTNSNLSACMLTPPNSISGDSQQIENFEDGNTALLRNSIALSHNFDSFGSEYLMPITSWMYGGYRPYGSLTYDIPQ